MPEAIADGTARTKLRKARADLRDSLTRLSNDPSLVESTVENLAGWAAGLRELWGV